MGIPIDIFTLHLLRGEDAGCQHYLLLRVGRPAFNNADEGDYAGAVDVAEKKVGALIRLYEAEVLPRECAGRHAARLVGELQARPTGDELSEGRGGFYVELWVAETRFGRPWVLMGTAENEEEFRRAVEDDEDLSSLGASGPAERRRAYFLAEREDAPRKGS